MGAPYFFLRLIRIPAKMAMCNILENGSAHSSKEVREALPGGRGGGAGEPSPQAGVSPYDEEGALLVTLFAFS